MAKNTPDQLETTETRREIADSDGWLTLSHRALRALDEVDNMPPSLRSCVHEFGSEIVSVLRGVGITEPTQIQLVVHAVWNGARNPAQRTGTSKRSHPSPVLGHLDWLLIQSGATIAASTLIRVLAMHSMVIVPRDPSTVMVEASMAEVTPELGVLSKPQKHKRRLRAAIEASTRRLWPHLEVTNTKR